MQNSTRSAVEQRAGFWPLGWWKLMEIRIGIIPSPVHLLPLAVIGYFVYVGKLPTEINMMIAVLVVLGFTCAELGKRLPIVVGSVLSSPCPWRKLLRRPQRVHTPAFASDSSSDQRA